jgi:hypothetical protein
MKTAVAAIAAIAIAAACHSSDGAKAGPDQAAPTHPVTSDGTGKGPATPSGGGSPVQTGDDSSFNLKVAAPDGAKAGAESVAHVTVTPGSGYHVNQDFPTKLVLTPPDGVQIAKAELHKEDATAFDSSHIQFDVKLTPAKAGNYKVTGTFKFAVCTDTSCDPKKREIAFDVAAQ